MSREKGLILGAERRKIASVLQRNRSRGSSRIEQEVDSDDILLEDSTSPATYLILEI